LVLSIRMQKILRLCRLEQRTFRRRKSFGCCSNSSCVGDDDETTYFGTTCALKRRQTIMCSVDPLVCAMKQQVAMIQFGGPCFCLFLLFPRRCCPSSSRHSNERFPTTSTVTGSNYFPTSHCLQRSSLTEPRL